MSQTSFGRIASDFIATALLFREAPEEVRPEHPALRNHMLALLDAFRRDPSAQTVPEEVEEARFALVAFADEMIIVSSWSQREEWRKDSLQLQIYLSCDRKDGLQVTKACDCL